MSNYEHLTRGERLQRIGTLLAKEVTLLLTREADVRDKTLCRGATIPSAFTKNPPKASPTTTDCSSHPADNQTTEAIVLYLHRVGSASPRDIQLALDLSKATTFRRLQELVQTGVLLRTGKTTAIRYRAANAIQNSIPCNTSIPH